MRAPHPPEQNRLVAALSTGDGQQLLLDLELIPLRPVQARVHPLTVSIQDGTR
jgi:hypothetical protein